MDKETIIKELKETYPNGHEGFIPLLVEAMNTHSAKNDGYARGGDPLGNFNRVSLIKRQYQGMDWATPTGVCLGYMLKQLDCCLWQLARGYKDDGEPPEERLKDVLVYVAIAMLLLNEPRYTATINSSDDIVIHEPSTGNVVIYYTEEGGE